jgi:hypothetical protein
VSRRPSSLRRNHGRMAVLAKAALDEQEREVLERFVAARRR